MAPVLILERLTVAFPLPDGGWLEATREVDLSLERGRVLALIGESGSGKTTVLNAMAGLLPAEARVVGSLGLDGGGSDLLAPGATREGVAGRRIGMIFQNPGASLNPVLRVGATVAEVAAVHQGLGRAAAWRAAVELLDRVGIDDPARRASDYPHRLSGGQKQRVAIAAALAGKPGLILADEPTTALDAMVQAQILDLLLALVDQDGVGLVLVTHDLAVAGAVADEIAVMYAGRIVEQGPAEAVVRRPLHPYAVALAGAALPFGGVAATGDAPFPELPPADPALPVTACAFAPRCPLAIDRCRSEHPPLEPQDRGHAAACWRAGEAAP
ncbi:MAG: ABC transporter ATP-binding protein [Geminicoccaceae bacterium]